MAASIKISELNSLSTLTGVDLFLVSDMETGTSRKISYTNLKSILTNDTNNALSSLRSLIDANASNFSDEQARVNQLLAEGMWYFADQASFPPAAGNHGRVVHSHADGAQFYAHGGQWVKLANDSQITDLTAYVDSKVAGIVDLAPESLNTLNELAEALGDDPALVSALSTRVTALEADPTTAAALSVVQADVDQNEADADAAIAALQADVDQNEADADAAIAAVQADVDQNEADADAAIAAVQADVDQNEADADAADANLQTQINTINTTISNLEIDIAPETLNSINEIAAALGDNPQIILNLQAELTAYKAHIEERNLELALAYDVPVYIETLQGG